MEKIITRAEKLNVPKFIIQEIWEQIVFWSELKIKMRLNWTKDQWAEWYYAEV